MTASTGIAGSVQKKKIKLRPLRSAGWIKAEKIHTTKTKCFIEHKQDPYNHGGYHPPSIIWLETKKWVLGSLVI
jgi:hypothetical protein